MKKLLLVVAPSLERLIADPKYYAGVDAMGQYSIENRGVEASIQVLWPRNEDVTTPRRISYHEILSLTAEGYFNQIMFAGENVHWVITEILDVTRSQEIERFNKATVHSSLDVYLSIFMQEKLDIQV